MCAPRVLQARGMPPPAVLWGLSELALPPLLIKSQLARDGAIKRGWCAQSEQCAMLRVGTDLIRDPKVSDGLSPDSGRHLFE
jgi:hypothetical protein